MQEFSIPHGKIVIIGENEEESDSASLVYYVEKLKPKIGEPSIVVCLDSGVASYDRLWLTTSLRGNIILDLTIKTIKAGIHSGAGSGIVPSNFRILQQLLSRVEDKDTGNILLKELHMKIEPRHYIDKANMVSAVGNHIISSLPLEEGLQTVSNDLTLLAINNSLVPTLVVTGIEGLPVIAKAGNVLHPKLTTRLSFRLPPGVNGPVALEAIKKELLRDPPYAAKVSITHSSPDSGWEQKPISNSIHLALEKASVNFFGKSYLTLGEGGTIPFMGFLGETFPSAEFLITGVLGNDSNAHSVDENLDIPYLKKLICCLIDVFSSLSKGTS